MVKFVEKQESHLQSDSSTWATVVWHLQIYLLDSESVVVICFFMLSI